MFRYPVYGKAKSPIIPFRVLGRHGWKVVWAYVDSGASYSILSVREAERLGLELREGRRISVVVGNGERIPVYLFRLAIRIGELSFEGAMGFSEKLGVGFNLLGRKDVFDRFRICFDEREGEIAFFPNRRTT